VSILRIAAQLIRRASQDVNFSWDLDAAVQDDEEIFERMVHAAIRPSELPALSPSEWLWYAKWRQGRGGYLDQLLLEYLEAAFAGGSRYLRFQLRSLVMNDAGTLSAAASMRTQFQDESNSIGLLWIRQHILRFADSAEIARDALQNATPVAWYSLRVLSSLEGSRGQVVRGLLERLAEERELGSKIRRQWG
jgi:hypothetical protein